MWGFNVTHQCIYPDLAEGHFVLKFQGVNNYLLLACPPLPMASLQETANTILIVGNALQVPSHFVFSGR